MIKLEIEIDTGKVDDDIDILDMFVIMSAFMKDIRITEIFKGEENNGDKKTTKTLQKCIKKMGKNSTIKHGG